MDKIIIAAIAENGVIGIDNRLPWNLPADRRLFRQTTYGHTVIMGRHTFSAIGGPLPGRRNIVVSRTLNSRPGVTVCQNFSEALRAVDKDAEKVFFIGGTGIYRAAFCIANRMLLSRVHGEYSGDTFFPSFDVSQWKLCQEKEYEGFKLQVLCRRP